MIIYLNCIGSFKHYYLKQIIVENSTDSVTMLETPWFLYTIDGCSSPNFSEIE